MKRLIASTFGKYEEEYSEHYVQLIDEDKLYKSKGIDLLHDVEKQFLEFLIETYKTSRQYPSKAIFEDTFTNIKGLGAFENMNELPLADFRVYIGIMVAQRTNKQISKKILEIQKKIENDGMTDEHMETLDEYRKLSNKGKSRDIQIGMDFKAIYEEKLSKHKGLITNIPEIDSRLGGFSAGTITTIAGFTSHFKTTFAMNVAYINTYHYGYNLIYLSLETPKEDMYYNLLCRHSYDRMFNKFNYIPHDKIRQCNITPEEKEYLYNVVEPDLNSDFIDPVDGVKKTHGRLIILDESDFVSMSFTDIYNVFERLDETVNGGIDGFIVDYVQLCKFTDNGKNADDNKLINSYIAFFRRLTHKFRSGDKKKRLIGVLLAQINRENWKKARRKNGVYDLTCLADANELERGSYRVITSYTTEEMKALQQAQLQILKNRGGRTMADPLVVFAEGDSYVYGEGVESFGVTLGGNTRPTNMGSLFDDEDSSTLNI